MHGGTDRLFAVLVAIVGEGKGRGGLTLGETNGVEAVLELVNVGDLVCDDGDLVVHVSELVGVVE
jgi:hypothetical protein